MIGYSPVPSSYARGRAKTIPPRRIHNSRETGPVPIVSMALRTVFLCKGLVVCSFPGKSNGSCGTFSCLRCSTGGRRSECEQQTEKLLKTDQSGLGGRGLGGEGAYRMKARGLYKFQLKRGREISHCIF